MSRRPIRGRRPSAFLPAAIVVLALRLAAPDAAWAAPQERAGAVEAASRATVFIRVIGDIDITPARPSPAADPRLHRSNVEVATGSGFLVSPLGQILTCHHVVADGERTGLVDGRQAKVQVTVRRIEVFVPSAAASAGGGPERYEAAVVAGSPDLDVAMLSISGPTFATADLGDSDALEPGDGLDALGFPFGRDVEIGRPADMPAAAPSVSISHGDFSAFRGDESGTTRFLQTSAIVNPGNSGGPILDADGFVVGIVARRLTGAGSGIGFAVPINLVKEYLESGGLDGQLPFRRAGLGAAQAFENKGLRMRLPWGVADASPYRTRVDSGASPSSMPTLRVDRVLSSWDVIRLASSLASGESLETFAPIGTPVQRVRVVGGRRVVTGRVNGLLNDGGAVRVEYAVFDLGQDVKVVARYLGPPAALAYSASVFRASLGSLDADLLRRAGVEAPSAWTPIGGGSSLREVVMPAAWVPEPLAPLGCRGLADASEAIAVSPSGDFSHTLRVGLLRLPGLSEAEAAAACGTPAADRPGGYVAAVSQLGATLFVAGRFVPAGDGLLLRYEVVGPADQRAALQTLFAAWMSRLPQ